MVTSLRARQRLDKYRIERRLAEGGFASIYEATDTIEGVRVALKIPHAQFLTKENLDIFRREVRLTARLDHPNILPIKNASFVGDLFVIATPLGVGSLADRLRRRIAASTALDLAEEMLEAVAHAHEHRVIHCDIKPENFILFPGPRVRLGDFGIARLALRTRSLSASGAGTVGYLAPEQAMGKPSFRSDVFSLGLVIYRMLAGVLPEWPYRWPLKGSERLRQRYHPELVALLRKAIELDERHRYRDAVAMQTAFLKLRPRALRQPGRRRRRASSAGPDWDALRVRDFRRRFATALHTRAHCSRCEGPVSESMRFCPWCGVERKVYRGPTDFPRRCTRCGRGMKSDWRFCAWCYGAGVEPQGDRQWADRRYVARCSNPECSRKDLMPFMRYCPWCHRKVNREWKIEGSPHRCSGCGWGALPEHWQHCPWCGRRQGARG